MEFLQEIQRRQLEDAIMKPAVVSWSNTDSDTEFIRDGHSLEITKVTPRDPHYQRPDQHVKSG
jgi:hypothetical protein